MIAVVSACGSNFTSVQAALERLGQKVLITQNAEKIKQASHVILPGVGVAQQGMEQLAKANLISTIQNLQQPVLGICLGMQLLFEHLHESNCTGLGLIPGQVGDLKNKLCNKSENSLAKSIKVPHMGWNKLSFPKSFLFHEVPLQSYVYFVHRYAVPLGPYTIAKSNYGVEFSAAVAWKNFYGVQFHPERSGVIGAQILKNFIISA